MLITVVQHFTMYNKCDLYIESVSRFLHQHCTVVVRDHVCDGGLACTTCTSVCSETFNICDCQG